MIELSFTRATCLFNKTEMAIVQSLFEMGVLDGV